MSRGRGPGWLAGAVLALASAVPGARADVYVWTGEDGALVLGAPAPAGAHRLGVALDAQALAIAPLEATVVDGVVRCGERVVMRPTDDLRVRGQRIERVLRDASRRLVGPDDGRYWDIVRRQMRYDQSTSASADLGAGIAHEARAVEQVRCRRRWAERALARHQAERPAAWAWLDELGELQITETAPGGADDAHRLDVYRTAEALRIDEPGPREREGRLYCGDRELRPGKGDALEYLNLRWYIDEAPARIAATRVSHRERVDAQVRIDRDPNAGGDVSGAIVQYAARAERDICRLAWSRERARTLEPAVHAFLAEAEANRKALEAVRAHCPEKPDIKGWTRDPRAFAWVECQDRTRGAYNRALRAHKRTEPVRRWLAEIGFPP